MDPKLLEPEELKVECELRNIRGLQSIQQSMLDHYLKIEMSGEEHPPNRAHSAALKNPKRELSYCAGKIIEIQESLKNELRSDSGYKSLVLIAMRSRAIHYRSRIVRISSSPTVADEFQKVLDLCDKLIDVLNIADVEDENLDKSIQDLENLDNTAAKTVFAAGNLLINENQIFVPGSSKECEALNQPATFINPPPNPPLEQQPNSNLENIPVPNQISVPIPNFPPPIPVPSAQDVGINPQPIIGQQVVNPDLLNQLSVLISQLNPIINPNNSMLHNQVEAGANHQLPVANAVGPVSSSPHFQNSPYNQDFRSRPQFLSQNDSKPSIVHKWNMSYDGSKDGLNVERFLYRVETNASSYNLPQYKLLTDIQYLLKGKALNWYWAYKEANRPNSWLDFRNAMKRQFQDDRNDFDIRQTIGERKQKVNESFQDFFTAISEMTLALSGPLSDFDLMLILHGNMRSGLKEKLAGKRFNTSADLFDECVHVENTWRQIEYVPENHKSFRNCSVNNSNVGLRSFPKPNPISREVHAVDSGNASVNEQYSYGQESNDNTCNQSLDVAAFTPGVRQINSSANPLFFSKELYEKVKCWNCGISGHFYYRCSQPLQHVFCRGCGQSDIIFEFCVKCQGNSRREARAGNQTSQNTQSNPNVKYKTEDAASNTDPEFHRILQRNKQT